MRNHGVELPEWLGMHVQRRLRFALDRFAPRINRVTVRLVDLNGPRGGIDKQCRITVELIGSKEMIVEDQHQYLCVAVDRSSGRVGHLLARALARDREFQGAKRAIRQAETNGSIDRPKREVKHDVP